MCDVICVLLALSKHTLLTAFLPRHLAPNEVLTTNDTVIDQDNSTYDAINNVTMSKSDADGAEISCELFYRNTTLEQYKITRLYEASKVSTTENFEDYTSTEATPGNRVNGLASSFLLVISALLINIFAIKI
ncbi:jg21218 [Pararge aegeria aegeria]|uniref:Jg21218 protein n=1 Tax=Pararge aegeria aegeria TaxID=348720 RepID=A0A8S4RCS8_9NEOP|nr:jg21218 [Pararge aegeria aegeria]